jgi:hypothetical protein
MPWDARKNRTSPWPWALARLASLLLAACGGSSPRTAADAEAVSAGALVLLPVRAGQYQLSMSATCEARERTATGLLTLSPVSDAGSAVTADAAAVMSSPGEATLLWGQTDLDFGRFSTCFGPSSAPSGEPIHPSVLVEVLRWDGERHNQVLLVSTDASRPEGAGVAMWVERVDAGHIGGVWSRWELMGRGEGRWEADLLSER